MDNPFEGMTNGEVITMMFPNTVVTEPREDYPYVDVLLNGVRSFDAEWWNLKYNGSFAVPKKEKGYRYMFDKYDDVWGDIVLPN